MSDDILQNGNRANVGWHLIEDGEILDINDDIIEEILEQVDIYTYFIEHEGLELYPAGRERYKAHCPFSDHKEDSEPSFIIYMDTNSFYCFGCRKGGSILQWLIHPHGRNMHFVDAVKHLADIAGIGLYNDPVSALEKIGEEIEEELQLDNNVLGKDELNIIISRLGYQRIKDSNFNSQEIAFMDEIYQELDDTLHKLNKDDDILKVKDYFVEKINNGRKNNDNE